MRISDWSSDVCSSDLTLEVGIALVRLDVEVAAGLEAAHHSLAGGRLFVLMAVTAGRFGLYRLRDADADLHRGRAGVGAAARTFGVARRRIVERARREVGIARHVDVRALHRGLVRRGAGEVAAGLDV